MKTKKRPKGEIRIEAESNGKRLTLDPINRFHLDVFLDHVESTLPCGFRTIFFTGERGKDEFEMTSGAGFGSKYLTFNYKDKQYCIDGEQMLQEIFKAIDAHEAEEK